ncbi:unnamed protein product [Trypanosoma congolense IL3000]|uniref:WGS project CAEQ00000000 data, annotated contig 1362 n=1 Tax=Trypanosoma congolense (strain IL3000) TaxID=1068625 RepID=F9W5R5_TRYCI|nr:unnamed protein product [Trypanosoma congolense IL3000]
MPGECVGSTSATGVSDLSTLQSFLNACELMPLVDKVRLPGTPPASQLGKFHLCCRYGNCVARFTVSSILRIRNGGKGHSPLFTLEGNFFRDGCLLVDVTTVSLLAAGKTFDELFPHATISSVSISSLVQLVDVECIAGDSDDVVASGGASTGDAHKGSAYNLLLSRGEVSVIFHHSPLGVHFPVDTQSGAVYDSLITTDLCVMYYPLGSTAAPLSSSGAENSLPSVTIRRFTHLPSTWEQSLERDDTLKHNALYHFTDWVRGRVPCAVCELSGFRCAQLHQEDVGMSCRTYVVPLTGAILVVRWETPTQEWERYLPLLQNFVDTLHLEDPSGSATALNKGLP